MPPRKRARPAAVRTRPARRKPQPGKPKPKRAPTRRAAHVAPSRTPVDLIDDPKMLSPDHPVLRKLGKEVAALRKTKEADYLQRCLGLGTMLRQARTRLGRGDWATWLKKHAKITTQSARNYVALSTWAQERPNQLGRLRTLGASKLFLVARASNKARTKLMARKVVEIEAMSLPELRLLLAKYTGATKIAIAPARRVATLRRRVHAVVREVHELLGEDAMDDGDRKVLRKLLLEAANAVAG